jgi:hypothetical protein
MVVLVFDACSRGIPRDGQVGAKPMARELTLQAAAEFDIRIDQQNRI